MQANLRNWAVRGIKSSRRMIRTNPDSGFGFWVYLTLLLLNVTLLWTIVQFQCSLSQSQSEHKTRLRETSKKFKSFCTAGKDLSNHTPTMSIDVLATGCKLIKVLFISSSPPRTLIRREI